ncbi:hypothetical protein DPEC_G00276920 [Dallia pectoralis]|uniref:Uncharacterized protein n=1 Tax=Dallia pectoralis TaxID=75939 RepID=A0ACC2FLN0_DALPE|nr:hypothetical protein DPEC_G00276920 [Dallia pectoralis]
MTWHTSSITGSVACFQKWSGAPETTGLQRASCAHTLPPNPAQSGQMDGGPGALSSPPVPATGWPFLQQAGGRLAVARRWRLAETQTERGLPAQLNAPSLPTLPAHPSPLLQLCSRPHPACQNKITGRLNNNFLRRETSLKDESLLASHHEACFSQPHREQFGSCGSPVTPVPWPEKTPEQLNRQASEPCDRSDVS